MAFDFNASDVVNTPDAPPDSGDMAGGDLGLEPVGDAPSHQDTLPDGREVIVTGDPEGDAAYNHYQGDNPYGYTGTCGLCSCQDVLNQFGIEATEADIVEHAIENGECWTEGKPEECGGTTAWDQVRILEDYGIPAHVEQGGTLESLAEDVEEGHGVIIEVNAGVLWGDSNYIGNGDSNHAVVVTGVARDPATGEIVGYYINDSGTGESGKFVPAELMEQAWVEPGGESVVTDSVRTY